MKRETIEDIAIIGGLIGAQFVYAGNSVLLSYLMSIGFTSSNIVVFSTLATFIILSPFAFYFERTKWPKKLSMKLLIQLTLIAFGGVTLFQSLLLKGIKLSSPAMGTAMPSLAPGLIFIIAWTFRLEKVKISCLYSKLKILGTVLLILGALTMSLMHSTVDREQKASLISDPADVIFDKKKIIGCFYLVLAVFFLSSNIVLQASTLGDFPAPMSLCAITSLLGAFITAIMQFCHDQTLDIGWPLVSVGDLIGFSVLTGAVSGVIVSFNGWAINKRGPVMVSLFNPFGAVCSVILSAITIGDTMSVGSLGGMFLMFTGLYLFLWAKAKERRNNENPKFRDRSFLNLTKNCLSISISIHANSSVLYFNCEK